MTEDKERELTLREVIDNFTSDWTDDGCSDCVEAIRGFLGELNTALSRHKAPPSVELVEAVQEAISTSYSTNLKRIDPANGKTIIDHFTHIDTSIMDKMKAALAPAGSEHGTVVTVWVAIQVFADGDKCLRVWDKEPKKNRIQHRSQPSGWEIVWEKQGGNFRDYSFNEVAFLGIHIPDPGHCICVILHSRVKEVG